MPRRGNRNVGRYFSAGGGVIQDASRRDGRNNQRRVAVHRGNAARPFPASLRDETRFYRVTGTESPCLLSGCPFEAKPLFRLRLRGKDGSSPRATLRLPSRAKPPFRLPLRGNGSSTNLRMGVSKRAARPKFGPAPGAVCLIQVPENSGAATELSIDAKSYESAVG